LTAHGLGIAQVAARDAVVFFEDDAVFVFVEQAERRFVHRRALDRVEGDLFHQVLELFGDRRFAAADRAQQVKDLLAFFQALGRVAEVGDDLLDHFLHAVELAEGGINLDDLVGEDARQARSRGGYRPGWVRRWRPACARERWRRSGVFLAHCKILGQGVFLFPGTLIAGCVVVKNGHVNVL
jgi:hypothetical protein